MSYTNGPSVVTLTPWLLQHLLNISDVSLTMCIEIVISSRGTRTKGFKLFVITLSRIRGSNSNAIKIKGIFDHSLQRLQDLL